MRCRHHASSSESCAVGLSVSWRASTCRICGFLQLRITRSHLILSSRQLRRCSVELFMEVPMLLLQARAQPLVQIVALLLHSCQLRCLLCALRFKLGLHQRADQDQPLRAPLRSKGWVRNVCSCCQCSTNWAAVTEQWTLTQRR